MSKTEVIRTTWDRYTYMRDNGHSKYVEKANLCDDYFAGKHWDDFTRTRLESQDKPVLTINKIIASMAAVMGQQLKNRAEIGFKPFKGGTQAIASKLDKLYLQVAASNMLEWKESNVADNGFITSRGFYDIRVEFDENAQGDITITTPNPRNVLIDPDAEIYDPAEWKDVMTTKWVTLDDIAVTYGKDKADEVKAGGSALPYNYDALERTHQTFGNFTIPPSDDDQATSRRFRLLERQHKKRAHRWFFIDPATGDSKPVPDDWPTKQIKRVARESGIETIRKLTQRIRWTVTCYNTVLHDEWSPYENFTIVPYFPFFRHGNTIGLVENLISSQDLLNKTESQELHIVNTTANSGWKVRQGSLQNMTIEQLEQKGAETGLVLELDDIGNIEKITPNTVPSGLDRISFKADEFIKEISGISDSARGFDRADVAAKAIKAKQAAGSVNLAKPLDNLARTRHLLAFRIRDLIQQFYAEERTFQITGDRLDAKTEEFSINDTPDSDVTIGKYSVVVTSVPARDNFQESQFQEAVQLRELGVQLPDSVLIQNSSLENKEEILQTLNPSEEEQQYQQQLRQMELQEKQVEVAEKQTKAILNRAQAMLAMARAQQVGAQATKIGVEIDQNANGVPDVNPMQAMQMERQDELNRRRLDLDERKFDFDRADKERSHLEKLFEQRQTGGSVNG